MGGVRLCLSGEDMPRWHTSKPLGLVFGGAESLQFASTALTSILAAVHFEFFTTKIRHSFTETQK